MCIRDSFRRGSITENYRKCGKGNCACAAPDHPGHGPRQLWTRSGPGGRTKGRQLAAGPEVDKVRRELANYQEFVTVSAQIVEVNEAICEARPISADSPTSTAVTSRRSSKPVASSTCRRLNASRSTRRWATSRPTPSGCATPTSANSATSSAPAQSKPVARPSSANASNSPGCAGACAAPPASPPCAAKKPAAAGTKSGTGSTTRRARPDLATYKSVAHPPWCLMSMCSRNGMRVPHVICSRNLIPEGEGLVFGGEDEGLLDPVDVPGQVGRVGLGVEQL